MSHYHEEYRFGHAPLASFGAIKRAGLLTRSPTWLQFGEYGYLPLGFHGDGHASLFSGAGGGKWATSLSKIALGAPQRGIWLDLKRQITSVSTLAQTMMGKHLWVWAPHVSNSEDVSHSCNFLDILTPDNPWRVPDAQMIAENLSPEPSNSGSNADYFIIQGKIGFTALMLFGVETTGGTSFPDLYHHVNLLRSGGERTRKKTPDGETVSYDECSLMLARMQRSPVPEVKTWAGEMAQKRAQAPKEYSGIVGQMTTVIAFMQDEHLRHALRRNSDFSLDVLTNERQAAVVALCPPAEYVAIWDKPLRIAFTVAALYKSRKPSSPEVVYLMDEAARLKTAPIVPYLYDYGRGFGARCVSVWQSVGQVVSSFGETGLQSLLASSTAQIHFSVRDHETASMISEMAGTDTLSYSQPLDQAEARMLRGQAIRGILTGQQNFVDAAAQARLHRMQATHQEKQARQQITPSEVMNGLGKDQLIAFLNGFNLEGAVIGNRYPYWQCPELAGWYLDDPWHEPGVVSITNRFGQSSRRRVVTTDVPDHLAHLPQYSHGRFKFVEGYRP